MDMQKYIGTKLIQARPMTKAEYCAYRHWTVPMDEDPTAAGYLVEYLDGGAPNHGGHSGYISWSPAEQFNGAYHGIYSGMSFGHALVALEAGERVARVGWNGKGMWLLQVHGHEQENPHHAFWDIDWADYGIAQSNLHLKSWIGMKTADAGFVPWLASQTDMLAKDWVTIATEATPIPDPGYDAELREVVITSPISPLNHDTYLSGHIYGDRRQRFADGAWVTTSKVAHWNESDMIATTVSGTRYKVSTVVQEKAND